MNIRDDFILKDIHEGYLVGGYVRDFLIKYHTPSGEGRGEGASMRGLKAPALWHQQEVLLSETVTPRSLYPYSPTTEQFPLYLKCIFLTVLGCW